MAPAAEEPSVLLLESDAEPSRERALSFSRPVRIIACRAASEVRSALQQAERAVTEGYYVAGFLSYEAGYGLHPKLIELKTRPSREHTVWLGVFESVQELRGDALAELLEERGAARVSDLRSESGARVSDLRFESGARVSDLRFESGPSEHAVDFARIQEHLRAGDCYQVCQSLRAHFEVQGSPRSLFARLRRAQPTAYSALVDTGDYSLLSLSPELFFRKTGPRVQLKPMKGTAAAGVDAADDARIAEGMRRDPKTRAENVMIVDLLRNDIGRLAEPGSVRVPELFSVERFASLLQMTSTIEANVDASLGLERLMEALFPSGSVTGAPKLSAMRLIHELEPSPRGIFCGSIGYVTPQNDACFNVAIRSLCVGEDGQGVLGVGSGVVVDSVAQAEHAECLLKARFLSDTAK